MAPYIRNYDSVEKFVKPADNLSILGIEKSEDLFYRCICPIAVAYRDIEDILEGKGAKVDHATQSLGYSLFIFNDGR